MHHAEYAPRARDVGVSRARLRAAAKEGQAAQSAERASAQRAESVDSMSSIEKHRKRRHKQLTTRFFVLYNSCVL